MTGRAWLIDGASVYMTRIEHRIFAALFNARGRFLQKNQIFETMWPDPDREPDFADENLRVHVMRLRKKIVPTRFNIVASRSRGYRMVRV